MLVQDMYFRYLRVATVKNYGHMKVCNEGMTDWKMIINDKSIVPGWVMIARYLEKLENQLLWYMHQKWEKSYITDMGNNLHC